MIQPLPLHGKFITLEPIAEKHREDLRATLPDESTFRYFPYSAFGDAFDPWFDKTITASQNGQEIAYAVKLNTDHSIVGTTRFYDMHAQHARLTIGHTWYKKEVRGSMVNPEAKFLLLQHAFEKLLINRVEFTADSRNLHSQAAIKKLGATAEGILREHIILSDGYKRNTIVFSILASEWADVKMKLALRGVGNMQELVTQT